MDELPLNIKLTIITLAFGAILLAVSLWYTYRIQRKNIRRETFKPLRDWLLNLRGMPKASTSLTTAELSNVSSALTKREKKKVLPPLHALMNIYHEPIWLTVTDKENLPLAVRLRFRDAADKVLEVFPEE